MSAEFKHIFTPLQVGSVTVPNRLFVSAHSTQFVKDDPEGYHAWSVLSERAMYYHRDRAKGGFGLIFIGQTQVHPQSGTKRPGTWPDEAINTYTKIADACHEHGAKVMVQLNQNGKEKTSSGPDSWEPVWAPSALPSAVPSSGGEMSKEMDDDDIQALIEGYVKATQHAMEAGMDGVEVHAAHPHLYGEWLTAQGNKRTDRYGGSLENRLRIVVETIEAIRKAVGRDYCVGVRMNGAWTIPGGQTIEDGIEIAQALAATGQVDFLNVSGWPGIGTIGSELAFMIPWAEAIKKAVPNVPVFGIGRIIYPQQAEDAVASGQADMVGMTRASIADPELPNKAREGRLDDIRVCIGAGQGCLARNVSGSPMTCQQNPAVGVERDWGIGTLKPAARKKRVAVIGGGPAGMEAAMTAAQRGHQVTLYEKEQVLGGQINLITRVERRREFGEIVSLRRRQLEKLGVEIELGSEMTAAQVKALDADAVVVATGSTARRTGPHPARLHLDSIPGSDLPHVFTTRDVVEGRLDGRRHVAIIDGTGYYQTSDALEYLLQRGQKVSAISTSAAFAAGIENNDRADFVKAVRGKDVTFHTGVVVEEIRSDSVVGQDAMTGKAIVIEGVDAVAVSIGSDVNDSIYRELKGDMDDLHRIGDCLVPRGVEHAVHEGHKLGREL
jgi:2,4-dienoyl-CoA reductase-like NADH-dependent reductase (Old Yellow Enzyme family)/thioredoxin reductase